MIEKPKLTIDVPPSVLTEVVPRKVKLKIITPEVSKELLAIVEETQTPFVFWCYDETSTLNLNAWSTDKDVYIEKANAEIKMLRALLKKVIDY